MLTDYHQIYYAWSISRYGTSDCTVEHFVIVQRHLVVADSSFATCAASIEKPFERFATAS